MKNNMRLYNLFPLLFGNIENWIKYIPEIANMGFTHIYINPFHYPGFSGSLYAPKDYYRLNPKFGDSIEELKNFTNAAHKYNIKVIMDLVINHTAKDSPLTVEHNDWYKKKENGDIVSPGAWHNGEFIEWGDLATVDNDNSPSKEYLWKYWLDLLFFYLDFGFDGFRCDAAYQVSDKLWKYLILSVKEKYPEVIFMAETLGCKIEDVHKLQQAGFDYSFSSALWWDFKEDWFIKQYNETADTVKYIAFPESHDTQRAFAVFNGNELFSRIYFTSLFTTGWMITSGFEYGFTLKTDVVHTSPDDWEKIKYDFTEIIRRINEIKEHYEIFRTDVPVNWFRENEVSIIIKELNKERACFIINTSDKKNYINLKKYLKNEFFYNILNNKKEHISTCENLELESKGIVVLYEEV